MSSARFFALLRPLILVAALLALWQTLAIAYPSPQMPRLEAIANGYGRLVTGDLLTETIVPSLYRLAIGFAIGTALGVLLGTAMGSIRAANDYLRAFVELLRFVPAVAILPAALLLLGPTDSMRIFVIAFGTTFPVLLAASDGARRADPMLAEVAAIAGLGHIERLFRVTLPAALPSIFAGLRIALSIALITMVISELLAADDGIGLYILRNQRLFRTANVYAGTLVIGTIGFFLTTALLLVERRVLRWHYGWRGVLVDAPAGQA